LRSSGRLCSGAEFLTTIRSASRPSDFVSENRAEYPRRSNEDLDLSRQAEQEEKLDTHSLNPGDHGRTDCNRPSHAPHFQLTPTLGGFNSVFSGTATTAGIAAAPVALYVGGLASKDSKMKGTALPAGAPLADSEILDYVLKVSFNRVRARIRYHPAIITGTRGSRAVVF
jgi:hypothetical protein